MKAKHSVVGLLAALAVSVPVVSQAAGTLYVGGYGGSFQDVLQKSVIPGFESATGARVVYVPGNSTDTLAKLMARKGHEDLSVAIIDDGPMAQAVQQGLCAKLSDEGAIREIYPLARLPEGQAVGIGLLAVGLGYNTAVFAKHGWKAPSSWMDLANPKYKGRVVIPPITNGYGLLTLVMMARIHGGGEKDIAPGFQVLKQQVAPNVVAWVGSPGTMAQMMQTGQAALVVWGNGRVQAVADQGAPVKFVYPKEGAPVLMSEACVVQGGPQQALAQKFVQYLVSPKVQALLAEKAGFGPVNPKTTLSPNVQSRVVFGPEQVKQLVQPDYAIINKQRAAWTSSWDRTLEQ